MYSVLYGNDEPDLPGTARHFPEQTGEFRGETLIPAQKAPDSLSTRSYDAIISGYRMTGMDGITLLPGVREQSGDIPVILFTGRGCDDVVIAVIKNRADFCISKDGGPEVWFGDPAHKIRQAVRRKKAEPSLRDPDRRLLDSIDFFADTTFAIDRTRYVIAWNRAMEERTGVPAGDMPGEGDYEYAMPLYGTRRPLLIDVMNEPDEKIAHHYSDIYRTDNSRTAQDDLPRRKGHRISVPTRVRLLYTTAPVRSPARAGASGMSQP